MINTYKDLLTSETALKEDSKIQRSRSGKRKFCSLDNSFENNSFLFNEDYDHITLQLQETNSFFGMTNINRPFTLVKREKIMKEELEEFDNYRELTKLDFKYEPRSDVEQEFKYVDNDFHESQIDNSLSSSSLESYPTLVKNDNIQLKEELEEFENYRELTKLDFKYEPRVNNKQNIKYESTSTNTYFTNVENSLSSNSLETFQGLGHYGHHPDPGEVDLPPETQPTPPSATLVGTTITHLRDSDHQSAAEIQNCDSVKIKFETLHTMDSSDTIDIDSHMSDRASVSSKNAGDNDNMMMITPELLGLMPSGNSVHSDSGENNSRGHSGQSGSHHHGSKSWTQEDMDAALDALRNHDMSLTKASATFGIPSTTLWQRAHRLGIDTPKKDGPTKSWSDESLNNALEALRTGTISANKASKAFGIPSSTLYKIARREGIRLAAPFNASPTTWSPADLDRALEAIRSGQTSVQRASTEFGIPTGTLYGRCKREGIELSRSNPTPWSEDAMTEALEAVRLGHMSINQAAIHYNLPYSSLYGRFKRGKYEDPVVNEMSQDGSSPHYHHHQSPSQNHSSSLPDQMPYQGS
ncbi:uncharacterized protein LOC122500564 isoform X5 [Leptopilina heterotoma]|uniref:uncharacterized protein LOC122500564 isoform X5 n=1 Tax=Leptopilina heterotoma TaxID=63436 RepID=UPI001CA97D03|nr:uncharacterized protein LOC122500564 isoform X5 [Leptopilina heterotoma]